MNSDDDILGGGGGLGVYWDAPGSNYYKLSILQKNYMDDIKTINRNVWSYLRNDINNKNIIYQDSQFELIIKILKKQL